MEGEQKAKKFLDSLHIADRAIIGKRVKRITDTMQNRYTLIELLAKYELELNQNKDE